MLASDFMDRQVNGQELYNFLFEWRSRIVKLPKYTDEQFGQLLTLNTILAYIDDHLVKK